MTITFLCFGNQQTASTRYRILQFIPGLRRDGHRPRIVLYQVTNQFLARLYKLWYLVRAIVRAIGSDMIVIQKILLPGWFLGWLRLITPNIVFDFDDAIWLGGPHVPSQSPKRLRDEQKLRQTLAAANQVIVGNDFLAQYARQVSAQVAVLPTVIDLDRYPARTIEPRDRTCLGWIGTRSTLPYLASLEPVFQQLHQRFGDRFYLKVIGDQPFRSSGGLTVKNVPWAEATEVAEMSEFDIGLMPLDDSSDWVKGKCAFKAIQYMGLGIVPVASPIGASRTVITDNVDGCLASNDQQWLERLTSLATDPERRHRLGQRARQTIHDRFSLTVAYPQWQRLVTMSTHQGIPNHP